MRPSPSPLEFHERDVACDGCASSEKGAVPSVTVTVTDSARPED